MSDDKIIINLDFINDLIIWLKILLNPSYWLMNNPYDREWDRTFNKLMEEYNFTDITNHTAKLGDTIVWVANHPYASFTKFLRQSGRPSRITIYKARKKLLSDINLSVNTLRNGIPIEWDNL